jgi:hypothetical protein
MVFWFQWRHEEVGFNEILFLWHFCDWHYPGETRANQSVLNLPHDDSFSPSMITLGALRGQLLAHYTALFAVTSDEQGLVEKQEAV